MGLKNGICVVFANRFSKRFSSRGKAFVVFGGSHIQENGFFHFSIYKE